MKALAVFLLLFAFQATSHAQGFHGRDGGHGGFDHRGDGGDQGGGWDHRGPGGGDRGDGWDHRGDRGDHGDGWGRRPMPPPPPPYYPPAPPPPPQLGSSPSNAVGYGPIVCEIVQSKNGRSYYGRGYSNLEAEGNAKYACNLEPSPFGRLCDNYAYTTNFFQDSTVTPPTYGQDGSSPATAVGYGPVLCEIVQSKNGRSYYGRGSTNVDATANAKFACNQDPNVFGPLCNKYAWSVNCQ